MFENDLKIYNSLSRDVIQSETTTESKEKFQRYIKKLIYIEYKNRLI